MYSDSSISGVEYVAKEAERNGDRASVTNMSLGWQASISLDTAVTRVCQLLLLCCTLDTYLTVFLTLSTECMVGHLAHLSMYQLVNKGVTVVVAAGNNNGDAKEISPARCEAAITVGTTNIRDARADFSNYGSVVDIFAPGENITSAGIDNDTASRVSNGTSMVSTSAITLTSSIGVHSMPSIRPLLMWLDWRHISLLGQAKISSLPKSRQCSRTLG